MGRTDITNLVTSLAMDGEMDHNVQVRTVFFSILRFV